MMEKYTFSELLAMRDHITKQLTVLEKRSNLYLGRSVDKWFKDQDFYENHPYHEKLRVVKLEIQNRINQL